jgi:hypothetical protein
MGLYATVCSMYLFVGAVENHEDFNHNSRWPRSGIWLSNKTSERTTRGRFSIPVRGREYVLLHSVQTCSVAHPDHSFLPETEGKNSWFYIPIAPYVFTPYCLIKHGDSFANTAFLRVKGITAEFQLCTLPKGEDYYCMLNAS